jgi:hypothetical protein
MKVVGITPNRNHTKQRIIKLWSTTHTSCSFTASRRFELKVFKSSRNQVSPLIIRTLRRRSSKGEWPTRAPWSHTRSEDIGLIIVNLGCRWRKVISFTLRPLYPCGKSPLNPLHRRMGVSLNRYRHFAEEKRRCFRRIKKNSVALVRERTIPTEQPPPVGEVSANFCG